MSAPRSNTVTRTAVLVVDRDPDLRELTATWLRRSGFPVVTTADPAAARNLLDDAVGCVVVDIPATGGTDARDLVAELRRRHDLRTVVTSVLDPVDLPAAHAALPKPFHRAQLVAAVLPPVELPRPRRPADPLVTAGSGPNVLGR